MTQEQYVSFETAKLLKNKGFNELTFGVYVDSKCNVLYSINPSYFEEREMKADWNHLIWSRYASAPTQSFILRWLREKYKLYIVLLPKEVDENFKPDMCIYPMCSGEYEWMIVDGKGSKSIFGYNQNKRYGETYEQACESAIKYCLENLI